MAFKEISRTHFDGFFAYNEGNVVEGTVAAIEQTGTTDQGRERGFVVLSLTAPAVGRIGEEDVQMNVGSTLAIALTSATRTLIGCEGKLVRLTFLGFKKTKKDNRFQDWKIEIDDGT
jgi:hypothetical protein